MSNLWLLQMTLLSKENGIDKVNTQCPPLAFFTYSHKHACAPVCMVHPPTGKYKMQISKKKDLKIGKLFKWLLLHDFMCVIVLLHVHVFGQ